MIHYYLCNSKLIYEIEIKMRGIQNIINRLQQGEIIEFLNENQEVRYLQYSFEDNAYIIYDEGFRSLIFDKLEVENFIRDHWKGEDCLN